MTPREIYIYIERETDRQTDRERERESEREREREVLINISKILKTEIVCK